MDWRTIRLGATVASLGFVIQACGGGSDAPAGRPVDVESGLSSVESIRTQRTGGMGTAFDETERAFSLTSRNINHFERGVFGDGKEVFEVSWEESGDGFAGLGPKFDAASCASCHADDGRAPGPAGDGALPLGMTVRLATDDPATIDRYGRGLSSNSTGPAAEAIVSVRYEEVSGSFDDGQTYSLRHPSYRVELLDGGTLPDDAVIGPRVAPQLPGLGLLELIPDEDLVSMADPDDEDGDGISGRLGAATDLLTDTSVIGRFGWNATQPTVEQQTATAFFNDMGLTSRYFPSADCDRWSPCIRAGVPLSTEYNVAEYGDPSFGVQEPAGGEVSDRQLLDISIYTQTLAVPGARGLGDVQVEQGHQFFEDSGCASCHTGSFTTRDGPIQGLSGQDIQPYTDLLLHDLGPGLGDQTIDGAAVPTEWRTPPLWGLGLIETVSGHTTLLHDGRARTIEEAILWHDGEAAASAAAYRALSAEQRSALLTFLESL